MERKNKKSKNVIQKQTAYQEQAILKELLNGHVATADAVPQTPAEELPTTATSETPQASEEKALATAASETSKASEEEASAAAASETSKASEEEISATAAFETSKASEEEASATAASETSKATEEEASATAASETSKATEEEASATALPEASNVSEEEEEATVLVETSNVPEEEEEATVLAETSNVLEEEEEATVLAETSNVPEEEATVLAETSNVPEEETLVISGSDIQKAAEKEEMVTILPEMPEEESEITAQSETSATAQEEEETPAVVTPVIVDADAEVAVKSSDTVTEQKTATIVDDNEVRVVESVPPVREAASKRQSAQIVPADSVQAEEVPTVSIGDLQVLKGLEPEVSVHSVASMRAINLPTPLVAQPAEYRRGPGEWIEIWRDGMRLKYVALSLLPVLLGSVLAWEQTVSKHHFLGHLDIIRFIAVIVTVILMQVGANLINDYYDYKRGIDTSNPLGPGGLIQQGLIKPTRVLITGLTLLVAGTIIGLVFAGGALAALIVVLLALGAYFFSATKWSLSSLGLSELMGFLAFGPLTVLLGYLMQTHGTYTTNVLLYSLPLGLLGAATVYANNLRDVEGDQHAGKRTLATLLGLRLSRFVYIILLLAAYAIIVRLGFPHGAPHLILISLWTLPILVVAVSGILRTEISAGFHDVMKQTLKLQTCFATLLIISLLVWKISSSLSLALPTIKLPFL